MLKKFFLLLTVFFFIKIFTSQVSAIENKMKVNKKKLSDSQYLTEYFVQENLDTALEPEEILFYDEFEISPSWLPDGNIKNTG